MVKHWLLERQTKAQSEQWVWKFCKCIEGERRRNGLRNEISREVEIQKFLIDFEEKLPVVWTCIILDKTDIGKHITIKI